MYITVAVFCVPLFTFKRPAVGSLSAVLVEKSYLKVAPPKLPVAQVAPVAPVGPVGHTCQTALPEESLVST